jgi:methionyl-tRNA synthetase
MSLQNEMLTNAAESTMSEKTFFITTPIYYINATPHIGHAYTQIAADARARFERARGRKVYFLTGTDENAQKVSRVAREQGRDPQEYADEMAQAFRDIWDQLYITYDDYVRTTEDRHKNAVQKAFEKLWNDGHLAIGPYSGWYSVPDETFFREEETVERDGKHYLANPTEDQTKEPLEWVEEKVHFFKLSQFQQSLLDYYAEFPETLRPQARRNETLSFIRSGLQDTSISRVQDWGIPLPSSVPEHEGHVVYVWFPDALLNYASAPGYLSDDPERQAFFQEVWPPDLQLMSKDIFTRFHATFWPALLQALDLPLPRELYSHGFWTVDGRKMSKRDPETIVEPLVFSKQIADLAGCHLDVAVDALRYYCLREVNFGSDGDFSRVGCLTRYNTELANGLGNLVNRSLSMLNRYFSSSVPAGEENLGLRDLAQSTLMSVEKCYETLDFSGALNHIWDVITRANQVIEEQKPWAKDKAGDRAGIEGLMRELLGVCQWCAVTLNPVMPNISRRLLELLNLKTSITWNQATQWSLMPAGHQCKPPEPLCPRIQNLDQWKEKNMSEITSTEGSNNASDAASQATSVPNSAQATADTSGNAAAPAEQESVPEYITYDDFAKVQLRAGKVLSAERIPKADKLLRLQVDIGSEQRQILAGIAQQFTPEEMVGKTVIVVTNLAPRKLRGFESQGMLLAASDPTDGPPLGLVTVSTDVPPGSIVR